MKDYKGQAHAPDTEVQMLEQQYGEDFDAAFVEKYKDKKYSTEEVVQILLQSTDLTNKYNNHYN